MNIRLITSDDNEDMSRILRTSLEEYGLNIPGTAYFDKSTDDLYGTFQNDKSAYFVAEENDVILGGVGIYPTNGLPDDTVELVKMYISSKSRGKGIGKLLVQNCIQYAKSLGYKNIYLETMPELASAVAVYKKLGFDLLDQRLGDTGHFACNIWMLHKIE